MEVWKGVDGYEGFYMISNLGNVKSLKRTIKRICLHKKGDDKSVKVEIKEKILKTTFDRDGYLLTGLNGKVKQKMAKIHRLVAIAFIINPHNKETVNHINGDKTDNRVENLEWCTRSENTKHAFKTGLIKIETGEKNKNSKLTNRDVLQIKRLLKQGIYIQKHIAYFFDVKGTIICNINTGFRWSHVNELLEDEEN